MSRPYLISVDFNNRQPFPRIKRQFIAAHGCSSVWIAPDRKFSAAVLKHFFQVIGAESFVFHFFSAVRANAEHHQEKRTTKVFKVNAPIRCNQSTISEQVCISFVDWCRLSYLHWFRNVSGRGFSIHFYSFKGIQCRLQFRECIIRRSLNGFK